MSEDSAPETLLERAWDARRAGATVVSLDTGDQELHSVTHESLIVPNAAQDAVSVPELEVVSFDNVQHLVSVAAGEAANSPQSRSIREGMAKLLERLSGPRIS